MSDNTYYIAGNLTKDPVVSTTPNGTTVVNFTIAATTRVLDPQTSQYKDAVELYGYWAKNEQVEKAISNQKQKISVNPFRAY